MATISGRVVDAQGRRVAGARVYFSSSPVPIPDIARVTGDDGTFSLEAPSPGAYELSATDDEHGTASSRLEVGDSAEVELRMP